MWFEGGNIIPHSLRRGRPMLEKGTHAKPAIIGRTGQGLAALARLLLVAVKSMLAPQACFA